MKLQFPSQLSNEQAVELLPTDYSKKIIAPDLENGIRIYPSTHTIRVSRDIKDKYKVGIETGIDIVFIGSNFYLAIVPKIDKITNKSVVPVPGLFGNPKMKPETSVVGSDAKSGIAKYVEWFVNYANRVFTVEYDLSEVWSFDLVMVPHSTISAGTVFRPDLVNPKVDRHVPLMLFAMALNPDTVELRLKRYKKNI